MVPASPFWSLARTSIRTRDCCPQRLGNTRSRMVRSSTSPDGVPPRRCAMDTLFVKVAGLDVHLKWIQCAVRVRQESGKLFSEVCSFGTMTRDLRALADYLQQLGVTHVAMESTGVLWKPVWN